MPKHIRKYSNRVRDARREELLYLRQKVKDLQLHLNKLRCTHKPRTTPAPFSSVAAPSSASERNAKMITNLTVIRAGKLSIGTPCATFSSVAAPLASPAHSAAAWKDVAQRQAVELRKAELENVRLRLILEKQIKVAQSLERFLKLDKYITQADNDPVDSPSKRPNATFDHRSVT